MRMKETLPEKQKFTLGLLRIKWADVFDMRVFPAALITFLSYISYGAILTLIPDWGDHLGVSNKGLFYMVFTLASLLIRFVAGKVSDRYGRVKVLKVALALLALALCLIGFAHSPFTLLAASAIYGVSTGMLSPAVTAWTSDLSHPEHRGKAMATMYISLEAGIGLGALIAGFMFTDRVETIPSVFYLVSAICAVALFYLLVIYKRPAAEKTFA